MKMSGRSDLGANTATQTRTSEQTTTPSSFLSKQKKENEKERRKQKRGTTTQHAVDDDVDPGERAEAGTHDPSPPHQHHKESEER